MASNNAIGTVKVCNKTMKPGDRFQFQKSPQTYVVTAVNNKYVSYRKENIQRG